MFVFYFLCFVVVVSLVSRIWCIEKLSRWCVCLGGGCGWAIVFDISCVGWHVVFVLLGVVCGGYYLGVGVGVAASVEVGVATSAGDWGFDGHWCMDLFVGHLPNMF